MGRLRKNTIAVFRYVNSIHQIFAHILLSGESSPRHCRVQNKIYLTAPVLVICGIWDMKTSEDKRVWRDGSPDLDPSEAGYLRND